MSTAHRVIKNTGYLYAKMGITMFISLYTTRVILNALGASDFGIYNVVGGAIAMLGFLHASMSNATQRFMSFYEGKGDKEMQKYIFNVSSVLHYVIALILSLVLLVAGYIFFNGILNISPDRLYAAKVIYASLIVSTAFTVISVPYEAVLNAHENMLYYAIVGVVESLLTLSAALIIVNYAGDKLVLYGILMAIIPFISRIVMQLYSRRKYEECIIAPRKYWDKKLMKEMTSFAGLNLLMSSSGMISQYGMGIVLNGFFGTILNAAQGIANQISGQLMAFSNTMLKALNPVIIKSEGSGNRKLMLQASIAGCKFSYLLLAFFAIPFIIETPFILQIWLKTVPEWAIIFSQLQLVRSLIEQLTIMLGVSIAAQGNIRMFTFYKSILNFMPIFLTYLFFTFGMPPYYLYIIWIIAGGLFGGILAIYFTIKQCGLELKTYIYKVLLPSSVITLSMFVAGMLLKNFMVESFLRFIIVSILTSVSFFFTLYFFFLEENEKKLINGILLMLKNKIKHN